MYFFCQTTIEWKEWCKEGLDTAIDALGERKIALKLHSGCLAKVKENLKYDGTSPNVGHHIENKDHIVVVRFMVIWPS